MRGKYKKIIRRLSVSIIGFPMLAFGVILIPLPGPGVLVVFMALFLLSFEYEFAKKNFNATKTILEKIYYKAKARAAKIDSDLQVHK